jgi:hypothetical protein
MPFHPISPHSIPNHPIPSYSMRTHPHQMFPLSQTLAWETHAAICKPIDDYRLNDQSVPIKVRLRRWVPISVIRSAAR